MRSYIFESIHRAFTKSWSKLGMAVNLLLSLIAIVAYIIVRRVTIGEILVGELVLAIWILLVVYTFTFSIFLIWEVQYIFPRMELEKRNTMDGAHVVIWNKEIRDLTDLDVELIGRKWISKDGSVPIPIDPKNRLFDLGNETIIPYDGGAKTVLLASAEEHDATFHLKTKELDAGHDFSNGIQHSTYEITIRVKGKIGDRPIYPQRLTGRLKYTRGKPKDLIYFPDMKPTSPDEYSKMKWDMLDN